MSYYMQTKLLEAFLRVLNISLTTSVVIVLVLAVRLLLKKSPKVFSNVDCSQMNRQRKKSPIAE